MSIWDHVVIDSNFLPFYWIHKIVRKYMLISKNYEKFKLDFEIVLSILKNMNYSKIYTYLKIYDLITI